MTKALQHTRLRTEKAENHGQRKNTAPQSPRGNDKIRKNNGGTASPQMRFTRPEELQKND
jgi:hypothetical protein